MIGTGSILYGIGETYRARFPTYNTAGALVNADLDGAPAGVLVVNGTDTAITVTITNPSTGRYNVSCSLAGRSLGDDCWVRITAKVGGVTQEGGLPGFRIVASAAFASGGAIPATDASGNALPKRSDLVMFDGTFAAGSTQTVVAITDPGVDDLTQLLGCLICRLGDGATWSRTITAAAAGAGLTLLLTLDTAIGVNLVPTSGATFVIRYAAGAFKGDYMRRTDPTPSLAAQAKTDVENAVWDAPKATHTTANSFGVVLGGVLNAIGAFTGTGVNTVLGFFKALMRKDAVAPSDLGGTFDPVADSQEAQSEAIAAIPTTSGGLTADQETKLNDIHESIQT